MMLLSHFYPHSRKTQVNEFTTKKCGFMLLLKFFCIIWMAISNIHLVVMFINAAVVAFERQQITYKMWCLIPLQKVFFRRLMYAIRNIDSLMCSYPNIFVRFHSVSISVSLFGLLFRCDEAKSYFITIQVLSCYKNQSAPEAVDQYSMSSSIECTLFGSEQKILN